MTTTSNCALRLQRSLLNEVNRTAAGEGTPVNQFINVAVEEKRCPANRRPLPGAGGAGRPGGIRPHPGQGRVRAAAARRRGPRGRRGAIVVVCDAPGQTGRR